MALMQLGGKCLWILMKNWPLSNIAKCVSNQEGQNRVTDLNV